MGSVNTQRGGGTAKKKGQHRDSMAHLLEHPRLGVVPLVHHVLEDLGERGLLLSSRTVGAVVRVVAARVFRV